MNTEYRKIRNAIRKGYVTVFFPSVALFAGIILAGYGILRNADVSLWWMIAVAMAAGVVATVAGRFLAKRWRSNAYARIADRYALQKWAFFHGLETEPPWYEEEETPRTPQTVRKTLKEDGDLPARTVVYTTRWDGAACFALMLLVAGNAIFYPQEKTGLTYALYAAAVLFCGLRALYVIYASRRPAMVMDAEGFEIREYPPFKKFLKVLFKHGLRPPPAQQYGWAEIVDMDMDKDLQGWGNGGYFLRVDLPCRSWRIPVEDWNISPMELESAVMTNRLRHLRKYGPAKRFYIDDDDCAKQWIARITQNIQSNENGHENTTA